MKIQFVLIIITSVFLSGCFSKITEDQKKNAAVITDIAQTITANGVSARSPVSEVLVVAAGVNETVLGSPKERIAVPNLAVYDPDVIKKVETITDNAIAAEKQKVAGGFWWGLADNVLGLAAGALGLFGLGGVGIWISRARAALQAWRMVAEKAEDKARNITGHLSTVVSAVESFKKLLPEQATILTDKIAEKARDSGNKNIFDAAINEVKNPTNGE